MSHVIFTLCFVCVDVFGFGVWSRCANVFAIRTVYMNNYIIYMPVYLGILGYPNLLWPGVNGPFMLGDMLCIHLWFEFGSPQKINCA